MQNGYNTGRDFVLDITKPDGSILRLKALTGYTVEQMIREDNVEKLDGTVDFIKLPKGWGGTVEFERTDDTVDAFFAQMEADYYAGKNTPVATFTETISNPDGSVSQYRFTNVALQYSEPGARGGAQHTIKQKIKWNASRRNKIR